MLLLTGALLPVLSVAAAPVIPPDTVQRGTLSDINVRDDYEFTAQPGEWTVVGVNLYQGSGHFTHGLRTDISSNKPFIYTNIGSYPSDSNGGMIAINGHDLSSPTDYVISEERSGESPSYALQLKQGLNTLSHNSQTVTGSMGPDGVVMGFEVVLAKRDTLDLRLRIPPEWTYNYHFALLLFSPTARYHQYDGTGGVDPIAESSAGWNKEQALTFLVMDPGTYLIVLLNLGTPDNVNYELEVGINGLPLADSETDDETLTGINVVDYYSFTAPTTAWSAAVVKARSPVDRSVMHSLHWPTPDSNSIAYDVLTEANPSGIIAINGHALTSSDTYYVREKYHEDGDVLPFTIQYGRSVVTIPPTNGTTSGSLSSSDIFAIYEITLQKSQTSDLRLMVEQGYNYDHDLGLYVFPPGEKYYSISGQPPAYADGPIAMSRAGMNTEQDVVFTCPSTGVYAIVVVNFATRDDIPYTMEMTIQGRGLVDDTPLTGDLNAQNREDLFQFVAKWDTWNLVGSRPTSSEGYYTHKLHSTALDTNPIREEKVGNVPKQEGREGETEWHPLGLLAVDGHELPGDTTYFVREEVVEGKPLYMVELENTPQTLAAPSDNLTAVFLATEFLHTYVVDLSEHDTIDIRVAPPADYTYSYQMGLYILPPGEPYRNLGTEGDVVASAVPGPERDPALMYTATISGQHLIVVANTGPLGALKYDMTYAVDGFPIRSYLLDSGRLDADNAQDAFKFDAPTGRFSLVVVRLSEASPAAPVTATLRWPTIDSVPLATAVLSRDEPIGAFVINGRALPGMQAEHYVHMEAQVPIGRTVAYQVHVGTDRGSLPQGVHNMSAHEVGTLYSTQLDKDETIDVSLKVPPDFTYAHEMGLYLFGPDEKYMTTYDPESGPRASCRYGPGTEQEIIYTAGTTENYAIVVLNHANLGVLQYNLSATVDGLPDHPARGYVDDHNRNSHYQFTVSANQWSVLASAYVSGTGEYDLKLMSKSLSTNPVAVDHVSRTDRTGVIAIDGWNLETAETMMFANVSSTQGRSDFLVHAATTFTDFEHIGHYESGQFGSDELAFIYQVKLKSSDHLDIQLAYDQGNWSSDVLLDLLIFEPGQALTAGPVKTITLQVTGGKTEMSGSGDFLAQTNGMYGFVLVNRGPIGPMGFSLGVYRRTVVNFPPMYPAILKAKSTTDSITVNWAPNQETDFKKYEIYLSTSQDSRGDRIDTISDQSASSAIISRLDPGHKYWVTVVVYDDEGLSTASDPFPVSTKELPLYAEPMLWVIILTIVIAVVAIVAIDRFIKRQKAEGVAASERGAAAATPTDEGELEVEGIEEEVRPSRRRAAGREDEATLERRDAVDFMRTMMGDQEE